MHLGEKILIEGLLVLIIFFPLFMIVAVVFHIRIERSPTAMASGMKQRGDTGWETLLWGLWC
jgi:hypothetical protein